MCTNISFRVASQIKQTFFNMYTLDKSCRKTSMLRQTRQAYWVQIQKIVSKFEHRIEKLGNLQQIVSNLTIQSMNVQVVPIENVEINKNNKQAKFLRFVQNKNPRFWMENLQDFLFFALMLCNFFVHSPVYMKIQIIWKIMACEPVMMEKNIWIMYCIYSKIQIFIALH